MTALFVLDDGPYFGVDGVDPWGLTRDARLYRGDNPVIAHPPCQRWGPLARCNFARWGGEHNRPGNDGGNFAFALETVRRCGGVLEHPRLSMAWAAHGVRFGKQHGWAKVGEREWTCEVWQSAYGHRAAKATRLLYAGRVAPFELRWDRKRGTHQVGQHEKSRKLRSKPVLSSREACATPHEFRDELIALARQS